ncbi:MAG: hypothetical protein ABWK05_04080 [Pyrobaculum sp.]
MRYVVLGVIDGLISAGTLSASLIFRGSSVDVGLAISIAVVVSSISALTVFVAEYSQQMSEMREAIYKLSLREVVARWTLLYLRALYTTVKSALLNFLASFTGAVAVLIPAAFTTQAVMPSIVAVLLATGLFVAGRRWLDLLEFFIMVGAAVAVGIAVGLAFPIIV